MTRDVDEKLGRLLREESAPPERDPMFRIRVLQRRERERFRRQKLSLLAGGVFIVILAVACALVVDVSKMADLLNAGLIALFVIAVLAAGLFSVRGVLQVVRQLRR